MQRAFEIVVMVSGGVSLLNNQKLYRCFVKPRFELAVFQFSGPEPLTAELYGDSQVSGRFRDYSPSKRQIHPGSTSVTEQFPHQEGILPMQKYGIFDTHSAP